MQEYHWNALIAFLTLVLGGGGVLGGWFTYRLGVRQALKDEKTADDTTGLALIEKAFSISEQLQDSLKKDIDDLRQQLKDMKTLVDTLVDENKKLLLENDRLMQAGHRLTEENNMLLKENKSLGEQILTVTEQMHTLQKAIHTAPAVIEETIKQGAGENA